MATLQGTKIKDTFPGLFKTTGNVALISGLRQRMTDGNGNNSPILMATDSIAFDQNTFFTGSATVDFTNATVTGLPSASGLINDTFGTNSLISNSSLTTNAAVALYADSIGIGNGANAANGGGIAIGAGATMPNQSWDSQGVAIGKNAELTQEQATAVGGNTTAGAFATVVGKNANALGFWSTAIGYSSNISSGGTNAVAVGKSAKATSADSIAVGSNSGYLGTGQAKGVSIGTDNGFANGSQAISIGYYAAAKATDSIAIGHDARVDNSSWTAGIAIGEDSRVTQIGAVALGRNITANKEETVSVNELEVQQIGGGITMYSPDGSEFLLTVTNAGALLITSI